MMSTTMQSTFAYLFLLLGSAAAVQCNLCTANPNVNNQYTYVPTRNSDNLVRTYQGGSWNCGGLFDAGMNGIFPTRDICRRTAADFAPCCNVSSGRRDEEASSSDGATTDETPTTTDPKELLEEEMKDDAETEARDLSSNGGHSCNLCAAAGMGSSVPASNSNKVVRTQSMGPLVCGPFAQAAQNGDLFSSQNTCNTFARQEFASTCCSSSSGRSLRGGN